MNLNLVRICSHTSDSYQLPSLPGLSAHSEGLLMSGMLFRSLHTNKYLQNYMRQKDLRKSSRSNQPFEKPRLLQITRGRQHMKTLFVAKEVYLFTE